MRHTTAGGVGCGIPWGNGVTVNVVTSSDKTASGAIAAPKRRDMKQPEDGTPIGDTDYGQTPKKPGAPLGNVNNLRHGLRAGQLPKDAKYIENRLNAFRRQLEAAVFEAKGEVSLVDAATIQTCLRWERHAALAQRWLNKQYAELKPEQRLTFSREVARASAERDKALATLKLDTATHDPWADFYAEGTKKDPP